MNKKILSLLGVASVAVGMTTGATSAQASTLGPGVLSIETDGGIFFSNNAVDFTVFGTNAQSPGVAGTGQVTTPVNPITNDACIFGMVPGNAASYCPIPADEVLNKLVMGTDPGEQPRRFTGTDIRIVDFELDLGGDPVLNDIVYTLPDDTPFLHFDTDLDDKYGDGSYMDGVVINAGNLPPGHPAVPADSDDFDEDDFTFYATTFRRRVIPGDDPGVFNVIFDFDGFFRDGRGNFKDTPAQFALFNGVTGFDPQNLPVTTLFAPESDFEFQAGGDGQIGTLGRPNVPEPGTILGLTALAGFGLASRLKRKAK